MVTFDTAYPLDDSFLRLVIYCNDFFWRAIQFDEMRVFDRFQRVPIISTMKELIATIEKRNVV